MLRGFALALTLAACACLSNGRVSRPARSSFVRLERTECLGRCPVYRVTMYADGAVEYVGGAHAPPGTSTHRVAPAEVERLMALIEHLAPWRCEPERIQTDFPQSTVTASRAGRERRIVHDHGDPCTPRELLSIEADIDRSGGHPQLTPHAAAHD